MATITAGDFRNGKTFEMDGKIMQVVEFQHVKPGKGAAFVRTKMKNVVTGAVTETSFNPTAKFEEAFIERKDYEYSYNDGDLYYFMDQETYDMVPVSKDMLDDSFKFIKENTPVKLLSYKGNVFSVETPNFVELTVTKADPGVKGDTATNVTKPATVETGAEIKVPTLDGDIPYTIPEGTQNGTVFTVRGKGIPYVNSTRRGDLIFRVTVEIPKGLNDKQKEAMRAFADACGEVNYAKHKQFFRKIFGQGKK